MIYNSLTVNYTSSVAFNSLSFYQLHIYFIRHLDSCIYVVLDIIFH